MSRPLQLVWRPIEYFESLEQEMNIAKWLRKASASHFSAHRSLFLEHCYEAPPRGSRVTSFVTEYDRMFLSILNREMSIAEPLRKAGTCTRGVGW